MEYESFIFKKSLRSSFLVVRTFKDKDRYINSFTTINPRTVRAGNQINIVKFVDIKKGKELVARKEAYMNHQKMLKGEELK